VDNIPSTKPGWRAFLLSWAALAILATAWAIATPLAASPDEPAHLIKAAAVVRGELIGTPTKEPAETRVSVPIGLAQANNWPCYAVDVHSDGACLKGVANGSELAEVTTKAGLYNPIYYALVGWPSLLTDNTTAMVLGMRMVSALICTAFLALAFVVLLRMTGRAIVALAFLGATTPMLFFLAGAVNPNALEVVTTIALLVLLLDLVRGHVGPPSAAALTGVAVSGLLLANTRSISPVWMALVAAIVLVYASPTNLLALLKRWSVRVTVSVLAVGVLLSLAWTLSTGTLSALGTFPGAGQLSPVQGFFLTLTRIIDPGIIGYFGWLNIPGPLFIYALWSTLAMGLTIMALAVGRRRAIWAVIVGAGGVIILPAIIQGLSINGSGYIWQGRYALAAFACLVIIAGVVVGARFPTGTTVRRAYLITAILVGFGQVLAYASTLQHYAVGDNPSLAAPYLHPHWSPLGGTVLWVVISAVGIFGLAAVGWAAVRREPLIDMAAERPTSPGVSS
jgi:hypothetical protein